MEDYAFSTVIRCADLGVNMAVFRVLNSSGANRKTEDLILSLGDDFQKRSSSIDKNKNRHGWDG
jgi:hypothetical protein